MAARTAESSAFWMSHLRNMDCAVAAPAFGAANRWRLVLSVPTISVRRTSSIANRPERLQTSHGSSAAQTGQMRAACICSQRKSSKKSSVLPFLPLEPSPPTELPVSLKTWAGNPSSLLVGVRYPLRTSNQIRKIAKSMRRKFSPNTASTETISHKPSLLICF